MEILIKTGHLVNCSRIHRVFFRLIRKFNSTVYHSSTWDEGLVRRIFAKSLIILLLLGLSPYSSQADNDEDSHRVMTRMFKAYAKFKMADYTGARDIWESIGQGARGEALFNLAILYEDGLGVEVDLGRSLDLYRRAAALGSRSAQYRLGRLLSAGGGIKQNHTEAAKWLQLAANQGDQEAAELLASLGTDTSKKKLSEGELAFNSKNYLRAAAIWRKEAEEGDVAARTRLAWLYESGLGVERNLEEAARLFRLSANAGDSEAQYALAVMLRTGSGISKNTEEALYWLSIAAAGGHISAQAAVKEFTKDRAR